MFDAQHVQIRLVSNSRFIGGTLTVLASFSVLANEPNHDEVGLIEPFIQELFLSELAFPQEHGELQIGAAAVHFDDSEIDSTQVSVVLEYGITDRFQAAIEIPYLFLNAHGDGATEIRDNPQGLGDVRIGALFNVVNRDDHVISIALEVSMTNGNEGDGLGEEHTEWEPSVLYATQAGSAQVYASAGFENTSEESAFTYSAAIAYPLNRFISILELSGSSGGEETTAHIVPGAVWRLPREMELGLGVPIGINDEAEDWGIILNWNVEF